MRQESLENRFWAKVDIRSDDECWEWLAGKDEKGYGMFCFGDSPIRAHRMAWQLANGRPPRKGYHIAHAPIICHNRSCCNPKHLSEKTPTENMQDKILDKTSDFERTPRKYTSEQISDARELRMKGKKLKEIASLLGSTIGYMSEITRGKRRAK